MGQQPPGGGPVLATTHLSAADAARRLGISKASLYAYVSRGLVRSEKGPDQHKCLYLAEDIDRLVRRKAERKDPSKVAADALRWGAPVLESALTMIQGGRCYYRGQDVIAVSQTASLEDVAVLLWGADDFRVAGLPEPRTGHLDPAAPLVSFQQALLQLNHDDIGAHDLTPAGVRRSGWRMVRALARLASAAGGRTSGDGPIAARLGRSWGLGAAGQDLIRRALVVCADHELNVSAFTVRCVASSRASPYAAVVAGLSALQGRLHGGAIADVDRLLEQAGRVGARRAVHQALEQGGHVPGFGHPLYPQGDPRAGTLLECLSRLPGGRATPRTARSLSGYVAQQLHHQPTIDFALAVLARSLRLPPNAGQIVFALGRTVGWIGHALEAYATNQLIRPRARYVGPAVVAADLAAA